MWYPGGSISEQLAGIGFESRAKAARAGVLVFIDIIDIDFNDQH